MYSSGSAGSATTALADRVMLLDDVTTTTRQAIDRVQGCTKLAEAVADSVFGSLGDKPPMPAGFAGNLVPSQPSRGAGLRDAGSDLHSAISQLEQQLERFRAL